MKKDTILNLMISHHALLSALFVLFRDEAKEKSQGADSSLFELTWETKKHFFVEENAIFNLPQIKEMKVFNIIKQLESEHVIALEYLKKFHESFPEINEEEMEKFVSLMQGHSKMEEEELYPRLDEELKEEQKKQIIDQINEVPVKSNK